MKNFAFNAIALGIISIMSVSQITYGAEISAQDEFEAAVNGTELKNDIYKNEDGTVMYPVREVSDLLGYNVEWNGDDESCIISDGNTVISFAIGKDSYTIGNVTSSLGAAPEFTDGLSYVPGEFLKGFFDLNVSGESNGHIKITSEIQNMLKQDETATVSAGELFGVTLEENPSTGYTWAVEASDKLQLLDTFSTTTTNASAEDNAGGSVLVGAPSMRTWVYKCDTPGEYTLKFTYSRSFDDTSEANTTEFKVIVMDGDTQTAAEARELEAKAGEDFSISLEENASTGYTWIMEKDDKVTLVEDITAQGDVPENMVGVPYTRTWTFKCDEAGEYKIKFTYARSFESAQPAEVIEYTVTVK